MWRAILRFFGLIPTVDWSAFEVGMQSAVDQYEAGVPLEDIEAQITEPGSLYQMGMHAGIMSIRQSQDTVK